MDGEELEVSAGRLQLRVTFVGLADNYSSVTTQHKVSTR